LLKSLRFLVAAVVLACVTIAPAATTAAADPAAQMRQLITVKGMLKHEQAFQKIADANGGTRVAGTAGYDQSVNYVVNKLRGAGYDPIVQPFDFAFFQENSPPAFERISPDPRTYVDQESFDTMDYSGSGDVTADVKEVADNQFPPGPTASSSNAGCQDADFVGDFTGRVALIQRGTCTFHDKALNAQEAGAAAVIIFNEGQADLGRDGLLFGTLGSPDFDIPVLGISFYDGEELHNFLVSGQTVTVHIFTDTTSEIRQAANVLADTPGGDPNRVIVQGSHLDSVPAGPGINDNGSGSAYNLESALKIAGSDLTLENKIRFAFWGAEEENLIGSTFYVNSLSEDELGKILLNLNFDMIASPNYVRFVYDGDGSDTPTAGPPGSAEIEDVFNDYFDSVGLAHDPTAFDGRSDYGPFIANGVPAGGLFTGAEGIKSEEQAAVYGGQAGVAYDHCYHQACDTINNLNHTGFDQMSDAAVTALTQLALLDGPLVSATRLRALAQAGVQTDYLGSSLQR
jgi:Zn-dependent M28 family amino/carboxypeptidase